MSNYPNIFEFISEEDIFTKYLYPIKLNTKFINPFRKDKTAGCIYKYLNKKLYFIDFATTKKLYSAMDIVMLHYNCDYRTAIYHISIDFNLNFYYVFNQKDLKKFVKIPRPKIENSFKIKPKNVVFTIIDFNKEGLKFWNKYGLDVEDLKSLKIKQLSNLIYNNVLLNSNGLIFGYFDSKGCFKIYQPEKTIDNYKFISIRQVIEGIELLDFNNKNLIITKSYKDVGIFRKLGFNSIAPPSETTLSSLLKINFNKFENVYIKFDPDKTGIEGEDYLISKNPLIKKLNLSIDTKDVSDYVKENNLETLKKKIDDFTNNR